VCRAGRNGASEIRREKVTSRLGNPHAIAWLRHVNLRACLEADRKTGLDRQIELEGD